MLSFILKSAYLRIIWQGGENKHMDYDNTFGGFVSAKRRSHDITSLEMSEIIGLSPQYYCDIEKNRRNPPDRAVLEKLSDVLRLSAEEKPLFYDLAGKARSEVPADLPEYITEHEVVRFALRLAKDKGNDDDWRRFINQLEKKGE